MSMDTSPYVSNFGYKYTHLEQRNSEVYHPFFQENVTALIRI